MFVYFRAKIWHYLQIRWREIREIDLGIPPKFDEIFVNTFQE